MSENDTLNEISVRDIYKEENTSQKWSYYGYRFDSTNLSDHASCMRFISKYISRAEKSKIDIVSDGLKKLSKKTPIAFVISFPPFF